MKGAPADTQGAAGQPAGTGPAVQTLPPRPRELQPLWALRTYLQPYTTIVAAALLALLSAAAVTLALPISIRHIIDATQPQDMAAYFSLLAGLALLLAICSALRYYLVTWLGERSVADLRRELYTTTICLDQAFHQRQLSGELLSRLGTDTTLVQAVLIHAVPVTLRNLVLLVGSLAMMLVTAPQQGAKVLLLVPVVLVPIILLGRRVRGLSRLSQERLAESAGFAGETLGAVQTVQAYNLEHTCVNRYAALAEQSFHAACVRSRYRALLTGLAIFMAAAAVLWVLWEGAGEVTVGAMSGGELGQFLLYAVLLTGATGGLSEVWGELQRAAGAADRLLHLLRTRPQVRVPVRPLCLPVPGRGRVEFSQVYFAYPSRPSRQVLKAYSMDVEPGETVALVGPSGAGKSTVFRLLLRFYEPSSGRIFLDGVDLGQVPAAEVRARFGLVPQETVLFSGSILDNIRCGYPDAGEDAVLQAAVDAGVASFVDGLPEGYDTLLGERGIGLSGGQLQCIAIARAVLRKPLVLLLDEATSALDAGSERVVQDALKRLSRGCTSLVIAHRLATVVRADRILVLDKGCIIAAGSHRELLGQNELYSKLAEFQFIPEQESATTTASVSA